MNRKSVAGLNFIKSGLREVFIPYLLRRIKAQSAHKGSTEMSLPRDSYNENILNYKPEAEILTFEERSKTIEHTDRFSVNAEAQKIKKIEDNQS
ncbi:MAG: hypothetical protein IKY78_01205 [Clostridia bacterium]|nr:hypothetical protein [Clostridia bacterium]